MDAQPETSAILDTASIVPTSPVILASSKPVPAEGPVPLSFPAILRNAGLQSRFAHLKDPQQASTAPPVPKKLAHRNDNEGKRWVRRSENARFVGNPHVVAPNKRDLELSYPAKAETFPIPLPPYLPRSISLPPTTIPATIPQASYAGHFSFSLKGARKTIRRAGPRTQTLVRAIETELALWIEEGDIILDPDTPPVPIIFPGTLISGAEGVYEVQRTPGQLVWWVQDDAWARYVIHCCARYHDVVSFSKDTPTHRLTYLLRPNRTRQAGRPAPAALATPPPTDPELSSNISSYDSDAFSLSDVASVDALSDIASSNGLSDVEGDQPSVPTLPVVASDGEADAESDLGGSVVSLGENMLPSAMQGLSVGDDDTPRARRVMPLRTSTWDRARSGSSPSRSPARRERRPPRRAKQRQETRRPYVEAGKLSFYDYLFG